MNSCNFSISEESKQTTFYKFLTNRLYNDTDRVKYFYTVATNNGFTTEFLDWYKKEHPRDNVPSFDKFNKQTFLNDIIRYYYKDNPDGSLTVENSNNTNYGYSSTANRNYGVHKIAPGLVSYIYARLQNDKNFNTKALNRRAIEQQLMKTLVDKLIVQVNDQYGITINDINKKLDNNKRINRIKAFMDAENLSEPDAGGYGLSREEAIMAANYLAYLDAIQELVGNNMSVNIQNIIAMLTEMLDYSRNRRNGDRHRDNIFREIFYSKNLVNLRKLLDKNEETFDDEEETAAGVEDAINDGFSADDSGTTSIQLDDSFRVFDTHDGSFADFRNHLLDILPQLASIPRLRSTSRNKDDGKFIKYNYDTENPYSIETYMDVSEVAILLYNNVKTSGGYDYFMETLERTANTIAGAEGLIVLYDRMQDNPDLFHKVFNVFQKFQVSKIETTVTPDGTRECRIVNRNNNALETFKIQCFNDFRSSAVYSNPDTVKEQGQYVRNLITQLNAALKVNKKVISKDEYIDDYVSSSVYVADITKLKDETYKLISLYYPNIDKSAVYSYIANDSDNVVQNATNLVNAISTTLVYAITAKREYNDKIKEYSRRNAANRKKLEELGEENFEPEDAAAVWTESSYIPATTKTNATDKIAELLAPYSMIKTSFNSRNPEHNNTSDILNNSYISRFMDILSSELNRTKNPDSPIMRYAADIFRGKQYIFSNILIDRPGENYGLFTREINSLGLVRYVPTKYAKDLLKISLFSGISDRDKDKAALYTGMSEDDYIVTAFSNFFNAANKEGLDNAKGITFADYFLRIPSDAPKTYLMTAPRYSTEGLFRLTDTRLFDESLKHYMNDINVIKPANKKLVAVWTNENNIGDILTGKITEFDIAEKYRNKVINRDGKYYIEIGLISNDPKVKQNSTVRVEGSFENNVFTINNILGIAADPITNEIDLNLKTIIKNYYSNGLRNGTIDDINGNRLSKTVNRNHPIFKQFMNTIMQEITNAGVQISNILVQQPNGSFINPNTNDIEFKEEFTKLITDENGNTVRVPDTTKLFRQYHVDGNGNFVKKDSIGRLILQGKVFSSDRFTLFVNGEEENWFENLFANGFADYEDGRIHLLYGGFDTNLHLDDGGNVILTNAQRQYVESQIEDYILKYVDHYVNELQRQNDILTSTELTYENVAEFALNYRLAYYNQADLLEGDSKFYKSFNDFLKRAKEVQGSGVGYGIYNLTHSFINSESTRELVSDKIAIINGNDLQNGLLKNLHDCKLYTKFRGVTVYNTIRTSDDSQKLVDNLVDIFTKEYKDKGITITDDISEHIRSKAEDMMDGYKNVKTNDAQSYITFEEWIRRISARGQFYRYQPFIERILDESKPLSISDIQEFIQVQKNFYYDLNYDEITKTRHPRQIKNAEFVLVPRLIRGTELEEVYNRMVENGIDQLNTVEASKAGKHNIVTMWDNNGNLVDDWKSPQFKQQLKQYIEYYDYNYLYTQQETPQHVNATNKAGLQFMKKIIDNIPQYLPGVRDKEGKLVEHPLWKYKQILHDYFTYNIKSSSVELLNKLGVEIDNNGNIIFDENGNLKNFDYTSLLSMMANELMRRGDDSQMMDYATMSDNATPDFIANKQYGMDTKMPLFANNSAQVRIENIVQSIFTNRITRQTLPGFHAAQITGVGFKAKDNAKYKLKEEFKDSGLPETVTAKKWRSKSFAENRSKYITNDGIATSTDLRYHPDGKPYIEVLVPRSIFVSSNITIEELEEKGLDKFIGYRIPTEGKQSMALMKIKGFIDDSYGSTIVVPDDWVAQTGSDFDIDSIYAITYENYVDNNGNIQKVKTIEGNSINSYYDFLKAKLIENRRNGEKYDKNDLNNFIKVINYTEPIIEEVRIAAKKLNLPDFDEFVKLSNPAKNNREGRNNRIIDCLIEILSSPYSLEENLSQSQFTDIVNARNRLQNKYMSEVKAEHDTRSPYDFLGQAENMQEAMSGRKLKGISVSADNFASIMNTVRPILTTPVKVIVSKNKYTEKELKQHFSNVKKLDNGNYLISIDKFGWTLDGKNIDDKLLLPYSSQTTALILDIMKEGFIPNVTEFSFRVFKLFPDLGLDYTTAEAFMMQPAISDLVNGWRKSNSVYAKYYIKPYNYAIRQIAERGGIKTKNKSIVDIHKELLELTLEKYPQYVIKTKNNNIIINSDNTVLDTDLLETRLGVTNTSTSDAAFDFLVLEKYQELETIGNKINTMSFIMNPDKYGAKQTLFSTREVFSRINDILEDDSPILITEQLIKDENEKNESRPVSINILDKIFPGIRNAMDGPESLENKIKKYIQTSNDDDSLYRPLQYFLKYSTALSFVVNSKLFATQSPAFVSMIDNLTSIMSGENPRLTEKTASDFSKYLINYFFVNADIISRVVYYDVNTKQLEQTNGSIADEKARVFGYSVRPDLMISKEDGTLIEWKPSDINNPNDDDIKQFIKFSPAQKVLFIKQHFSNGLVCNYITPNLVNNDSYRKNKAGFQALEWKEDTVDIETMHRLFSDTFHNSNPFLKLTALDLIKYGYIVEGRLQKANAIHKIISNDCLIESFDDGGTGLIDTVNNKIIGFIDALGNVDDINHVYENYVRSHSNMQEISHTSITIEDKNKYFVSEFTGKGSILRVNIGDKTNEFLESHGFTYTTQRLNNVTNEITTLIIPNKYITITTYVNNVRNEILYKIKPDSLVNPTQLLLIPLNKLEETEFSVFSANSENNKYHPISFYERVIKDYMDEADKTVALGTYISKRNLEIDEQAKSYSKNKSAEKDFDLNDTTTGSINDLRLTITKHFSQNTEPLYVINNTLSKSIKLPGSKYSRYKELDGVGYIITKLADTERLYKYLIDPTLQINDEDKHLTKLINQVRSYGGTLIDIYSIIPYDSNRKNSYSTVIERPLVDNVNFADRTIRKISSSGNENSEHYIRDQRVDGIDPDIKSVNDHIRESLINQAQWVHSEVERLLYGENSLNFFIDDPDTGEKLSLTDPKVFKMMLNNPILHRAYLKTLLDIDRIIETFELFEYSTYSDEEGDLQFYVNKIKEDLQRLKDNKIYKEAEHLYVDNYLALKSNNPNIKRNIISLLDGYHRTNWLTSLTNDLQDAGNPIFQIITKNVMANIRAKELQGERVKDEFLKRVAKIRDDASKAGFSVNVDNIIDNYGKFIEDYTEQLRDDLNNLYKTKQKAYEDYDKFEGSIYDKANLFEKYLQAKLAYDKFMLKNFNREISDDYYRQKIELEESMLDANGKFNDGYVELKRLEDRRWRILKHEDDEGNLDPVLEAELKDIDYAISDLLSSGSFDEYDLFGSKEFIDEDNLSDDPVKRRIEIIHSANTLYRLLDYKDALSKLNEQYFEYKSKIGFEEQVARNEAIVATYESIDPISGLPTRSETDLANSPEYIKAKSWLRKNVNYSYKYDPDIFRIIAKNEHKKADDVRNKYLLDFLNGTIKPGDDNFKLCLTAALSLFGESGSKQDRQAIYKDAVRRYEARDENGIIDGRKIPSGAVRQIKKEQQIRYGYFEDNAYSERAILHTASDDTTVYTKSFYEGFKTDGIDSKQYREIVENINKILHKGWNSNKGILDTTKLNDDELELLLTEFAKLGYDRHEQEFNRDGAIKKRVGSSKRSTVKVIEFIKNNVTFTLSKKDQEEFDIQDAKARAKGDGYYDRWCEVNYEWDEVSGKMIPNHLLWGNARPKESVENKYIDKLKTAAVRICNLSFRERPSKYYEQEQRSIIKKYGVESKEYIDWFYANHVYNPSQHKFVPLPIWTISDTTSNIKKDATPSYRMRDRHVREQFINSYYKPLVGTIDNYKSLSQRKDYNDFVDNNPLAADSNYSKYCLPDDTYDNKDQQANKYELELMKLFKETLFSLAKTESARQYFEKGYLPYKVSNDTQLNATKWLRELGKLFGFADTNEKVTWDGKEDISYNMEYIPNMPMLNQLESKETVHPPYREQFSDDEKGLEEFNKAKKEYEEHKDKILKQNREIHANLLDRNWDLVIGEFIRKAFHYNAILDNRYQLYYAQKLLEDVTIFETRRGRFNKLKKDGLLSTDENPVYARSKDENLIKQYNVWLHRLIFDEYKQNEGAWHRVGNILQTFTSTSFMGLNLRGGIANVTVGESNILGEVFAEEYFGGKSWIIGKRYWSSGILDYISNLYEETASTKAGAIIKGMQIVEYDVINGVVTYVGFEEWSKRIRDFGFTFNSVGEHMMQNAAMFSMMDSHRVVENPDYGKPGAIKYRIMNLAEYTASVRESIMKSLCTPEQMKLYEQELNKIRNNPNRAKEYAWFREDDIAKFIMNNFSDNQRKEYKRKTKELKSKLKDDFEKYTTVYDNLANIDGKMGFAKGSKLEELDNIVNEDGISQAYELIGEFKQRIISVNKKIHGNYGKLDAAQIEKSWIGRLTMQYHKHIPTGILKRYRIKGYFNEERGTVEKGSYIALFDFLAAPIKAIKENIGLTDDQEQALTGVQKIYGGIVDYIKYLKLYSDVMPDYQKAAMMRNIGDAIGMVVAVAGALLVHLGWDDDDDNFAKNLLLYEFDRLSSETYMWIPTGAVSEAKKLYSSPLAVQTILQDLLNIMGTTAGIILEGDDYDPYYHSGRYAGKHKLGVYLERRIPYYRNYATLRDIKDNNHYYKLGDNMLSLVPVRDIAESIKHYFK